MVKHLCIKDTVFLRIIINQIATVKMTARPAILLFFPNKAYSLFQYLCKTFLYNKIRIGYSIPVKYQETVFSRTTRVPDNLYPSILQGVGNFFPPAHNSHLLRHMQKGKSERNIIFRKYGLILRFNPYVRFRPMSNLFKILLVPIPE